jgi:hypothetical protein
LTAVDRRRAATDRSGHKRLSSRLSPTLNLPTPTRTPTLPGPLAVKAFYWAVVERMHAAGVGQLYGGPITGAAQWGYILLCVCFLDYLHDTWFYWTHRLLHWRPLYKWVHFEHHRCVWGLGGLGLWLKLSSSGFVV